MSLRQRLRKRARQLLEEEERKSSSTLASRSQEAERPQARSSNESYLLRYGRFEEAQARSAYLVIPGEVDDGGVELERLTQSLGLSVCGKRILKKNRCISNATFVGSGTLEIIREKLVGLEDPIVVIDARLSPVQTRNMESLLKVPVFDRHVLILAIFKRNARSHVAKLQVELAELQILKSRLVGVWEGLSRQRGAAGGKGARGLGESRLELDRRTLRRRMESIREKLVSAEKAYRTQSRGRSQFPRVALVGYTNAGKSSLMQVLTQSQVHIEDRLFATLDTTVRALQPLTNPKVLVSDTVGFVRDLPAELVASFQSTLSDALESDLLLIVFDISDLRWKEQIEVTAKTLKEIGASEIPVLYVCNKVDLLESLPKLRGAEIRRFLGDQPFVMTSVKSKESLAQLRAKILELLVQNERVPVFQGF